MPASGRLSVAIKLSEFPDNVSEEGKRRQFDVKCGDRIVAVSVTKKSFKKLEEAQEKYSNWVARIEGEMGVVTENGFALEQGNLQVFEVKPKKPKPETNEK